MTTSKFVPLLKSQLMIAMKAKDLVAKDILRTALGEIQTAETRGGQSLDDEAAMKLVTKLVKSNEETLKVSQDPDTQAKLQRENEILQALLPRLLGVDEIVAILAGVTGAIVAAPAVGPAMGIAMKALKQAGAAVQSPDVNAAVQKIRAG